MRWLYGITDSMDTSEQTLGDSEGQGSLECCSPWGLQRLGHDWLTEQQQHKGRETTGVIPVTLLISS